MAAVPSISPRRLSTNARVASACEFSLRLDAEPSSAADAFACVTLRKAVSKKKPAARAVAKPKATKKKTTKKKASKKPKQAPQKAKKKTAAKAARRKK